MHEVAGDNERLHLEIVSMTKYISD